MTRKTNRRTTRSRKTRIDLKISNTRLITIVSIFIVLTGALLYGGYYLYLKGELPLNSKIEKVDKSLYKVFFELNIPSKDIVKETTHKSSKNGKVWITKKKTIKLNRNYSKNDITRAFSKLEKMDGVSLSTESKGRSYIAKINIDRYDTHFFEFIYKKHAPETKPIGEFGKKSKISIIVDDVGISKKAINDLIGISNNFTFAILPNRPFTSYAVEKARENNMDILLHQPMEPRIDSGYSGDDAGYGVLLVGQTKETIVKTLDRNLSFLPGVVGLNNHMGSKFTENDELMRLVLNKLKEKNLLFVDSLTTPHSKGYTIAKELGLKTAKRDIFLDDKKKGKNYVKKQLRKLVRKSKKNGYSVGICHTYPQTIEAMKEEIPNISQEVRIIPVSELYK